MKTLIDISSNTLITGAPGTGKTMLANKIAGTAAAAGLNVVRAGSRGEVSALLRKIENLAPQPTLIVIDDYDYRSGPQSFVAVEALAGKLVDGVSLLLVAEPGAFERMSPEAQSTFENRISKAWGIEPVLVGV